MTATLSADAYRARQTEANFQASVLELAGKLNWVHFHPYDMRRSDEGWPDLVLVRRERLVFAELKQVGGKPTTDQVKWLMALAETPNEVYLWTPDDWDEIERVLR